MDFLLCNECDPTGVANALTFDNANACSCESFPCVHDRLQKNLNRSKRSKEMRNLIYNESLYLNLAAKTSLDENNDFDRADILDNNYNEVFYTDEQREGFTVPTCKIRENRDENLSNNETAVNRSKTMKDFLDMNERSLLHVGSEGSIPSFNYGSFGRMFACDRSLNSCNSFVSDIKYCHHLKREVKKQELGHFLKAKKRKDETSESNSSESDSDQSSSSSETTSSESSDSSCSSSSSSSSTSSSSESCDEDDSSSDSGSSDVEEDSERKRTGKKQKKCR